MLQNGLAAGNVKQPRLNSLVSSLVEQSDIYNDLKYRILGLKWVNSKTVLKSFR